MRLNEVYFNRPYKVDGSTACFFWATGITTQHRRGQNQRVVEGWKVYFSVTPRERQEGETTLTYEEIAATTSARDLDEPSWGFGQLGWVKLQDMAFSTSGDVYQLLKAYADRYWELRQRDDAALTAVEEKLKSLPGFTLDGRGFFSVGGVRAAASAEAWFLLLEGMNLVTLDNLTALDAERRKPPT